MRETRVRARASTAEVNKWKQWNGTSTGQCGAFGAFLQSAPLRLAMVRAGEPASRTMFDGDATRRRKASKESVYERAYDR